ncbi:MAG: Zn-binding domain-containing protein, partial [Candidatus Eremiobacterota bacterium]
KKNFFPNNMGRLKEKREIYKWVIGECVSLDRQISLEGLGLLRFNLVFPRGWKEPSYFSNSPWNLKPEEIKDLYQILLGTLRLSSIIKFPDDVNPEDDYFSPRNFEFYIRGIGSDNKNHIFSWLPGKNAQNRRYDYMAKLFKKINDKEESLVREQVIKDLQNIWEKDLVHSNSLWLKEGIILRKSEGRTGVVYQLNHEFLEAVSTKISSPIKWYKCSKCGNFSSINIRSICPSYRCIGPLEEYDITEDIRKEKDHYRHLYLNLSPISMEVHEHTAQLTNQYASEIQQNFITGKLNVLSCSTTFELGVDLGELQTVLMRNVPPETANYVQRAGRAGRRADVAAFIVTYAQRRSHDLSHFNEPEKMVGGKINPPLIEISNPKIMRRHMHSQLFSHLFKINPESFGSIDRFFMKHNGIETLRNILKDRPKLLKESLLRIIPEEYHKELEIDNWSWREQLYNGETGMMDKVIDEVRDSIQEYEELEKEASQSKNYSQANLYKGIANTLKQKELLGFLGSKNILPKYGFPIDVVPLDIKHHSKESEKLDLTRDLKLAISEYAPGSEVVAGGKIWVSRGVKKMPKRDWQRFYYAVCPECGKYQESIDEEKINSCKICNSSIGKGQRGLQGLYIIPSFGFVTSSDDVPKDIKDSRPQKTYGTRIYFSEYRNDDEISEWEKEGMEHSAYSLERRFSKVGELVVVNKGLAGGFYICDYCGYAELKPGFKKNSKGKKKPDEKKLHRSPSGKNCSGYLKRVHLGHKFLSDVLELRFDGNVPSDSMFWYSLIYALLEGASLALSIKRTDIDGCLNPQGSHIAPSIILFDTVPGGAGHVKRIGKNLKGVLENALKKVQDCECDENTSCYECLRNYQNQYYHDYLKRGGVARFLEDLLVNLYEESPDTPRSIELPDFPRWLSKEVIGSSEVIIITGKLELYKPEFNYAGDTDWFDILRRASTIGSKISLVIKSIPPAISRKPDEMALLFELSRLMQKGIELYRIKDNEDVPEWHIYMKEKADNPTERVLKCRDTKKFFSAGLSQQIGSLSWLNIFNQDIIGNIKSDLQSFIKNSCIKLIPKEIFRFSEDNLIRVPEGSSYDIDHFIGKFFSNAVNDITIKDPYIHNENQHKVLGSLLNMIEKKCVNGSTVSVNIITTQPDMRKDYRGKELIEKQKVFQSDL